MTSPHRAPPSPEPTAPRTWRQWLGGVFARLARACGVEPFARGGVEPTWTPPAPPLHTVTVDIPPELARAELDKAMAETVGQLIRSFEAARAKLETTKRNTN